MFNLIKKALNKVWKDIFNSSTKPLSAGIHYWRIYVFNHLLLFLIIIALPALIIGVYYGILHGFWGIVIINTFSFISILYVRLSKRLKYRYKVYTILFVVYILSVYLLYKVGLQGAGIIWLILVPVFASILVGLRAAILVTILNIVTFVGLGLYFINKGMWFDISEYTADHWLILTSNFIVVSLIIAVTASILMKGLDKSFKNEYQHRIDLEHERNYLKMLKEKAEESDRLKTSFLSNLSHEIVTPMNSIMGFSDLLLERKLVNASSKKYLNIINSNAKHLLAIINDIVGISRMESGEVKLVYSDFNLNELLTVLYNTFQSKIEKKGLGFKIQTSLDDQKSYIKSDEEKLKQILTNLLNNAIKFTQKGYIEVGYTIESGLIKFYVKDTGIGIKEEEKEKIFNRFTQANDEIASQYGGTGLGLSIVKSIVNLLKGDIWLESIPGKGTSFYFSIPHYLVTQKNEQGFESEIPDWQNKNILIIEDDDSSTLYLEECLEPTKIRIFSAKTGKEALKIYNDYIYKINIVLLDLNLPDMSGYDIVRMIHRKDKGKPVIAQTAFVNDNDRHMAIEAGFSDYLTKPFKRKDIFDTLQRYL
jgi:signal transduction histidine kinase